MIEKYTRNRYEDGWMSELKGNILGSWIKNSNKWKCETQSDMIILQNNGEYKIDFRDIPQKKEHVRLGGHYAEFKQSIVLKIAGKNVIKMKNVMLFLQVEMIVGIRIIVFYSERLLEHGDVFIHIL